MQLSALNQNIDLLTESFSSVVAGRSNYSVLDFPDHSNVGDSAIFLGEMALLRRILSRDPTLVCSKRAYQNDVGVTPDDGVVFLHGGGNFGDVWPGHQVFRENILERFPNQKIVQLPQSIHFKNEEGLDRCARVIQKHSDFTLFVRDKESFLVAQSKFDCEVIMCPDAALALGKLERADQPDMPILCMMRSDHEGGMAKSELDEISKLGPVEDWLVDTPGMRSPIDRILEVATRKRLLSLPGLRFKMSGVFERWATERVTRGLAQIAKADFVVTDRLHVHILCNLSGIPHAVFDNNYGKIRRYIDAWPDDGFGAVVQSIDGLHELIANSGSSETSL